MSSDFFERFRSALERLYPKTAPSIAWPTAGASSDRPAAVSPTLLSPHVVPISRAALDKAERAALAFHRLRESSVYVDAACARGPYAAADDPGNRAALSSLDFHLAPDGALKLIEVNTNASMGLMGDLAYRAQGTPNPFGADFRADVVETFRAEARASRLRRDPRAALIVDRAPEAQRLYVEFLLYRELLEQNGVDCRICDTAEVEVAGGRARRASDGFEADLIYNRDTDFYFKAPESRGLKQAFAEGAACVTPNPFEYQLTADKDRLGELAAPGFLERALPGDLDAQAAIRECLLASRAVGSFDRDALWADRKRWFFKPARAHGGKAVYRGSSIRHKAFATLFDGDFLAQEFAPPPTIELPGASGAAEEFKYDLRFIVYEGRIQIGVARLYQGQTTNVQTPGGGMACLRVV